MHFAIIRHDRLDAMNLHNFITIVVILVIAVFAIENSVVVLVTISNYNVLILFILICV